LTLLWCYLFSEIPFASCIDPICNHSNANKVCVRLVGIFSQVSKLKMVEYAEGAQNNATGRKFGINEKFMRALGCWDSVP